MYDTSIARTDPNARAFQKKGDQRNSADVFPTYLDNWQQMIRREQDKVNKLCEMSVTLHRRDRGLTLSDMCGRYGVLQNTQGRWLDWETDIDGEIHPINIVGPAIRATTNACLQSSPTIEIASANASAKHRQIALRWERVSDYFQRTGLTEEMRNIVFDAVQKDGSMLLWSYTEPRDKQTVPGVTTAKTGIAQFQCQACGANGHAETKGDHEEGMGEIPCPQCGGPAQAMLKLVDSYDAEDQEIETVDIKSKLIPFYNFTIDRYGAKLGGIQTAKWLQIQELVDRVEMETCYRRKDLLNPSNWSYQLQCDWALANGDWRYLNAHASQERMNISDFDRFERRKIYLHEEAYKNYRAPADYEFVNGNRKTRFSIKQGQTIAEAYETMYGENPRGMCFAWTDQALIDIISPEDEELNFREAYSDVHWNRKSGSYLSAPYYSIVVVQDDITLLNTMNHNIIARNAVNPTYYDSLVFSEKDFQREHIPSKNSHLLPDRDISKAVVQLPVPTPSPYLAAQLQFLWEIKDTITQVQPALRGEMQKGETFGAQRQQLEQSYGMLTSVLKSYAQSQCTMFKQKAGLAKKKWTLEQFQHVGSMFGELWTDEEVTEMCEIDFEQDLIVSYVNGSEMPQSNLDKEMKFFGGVQQLMTLGGPEIVLQMLGPEKINKIIQKVNEFAEFDFDLTDVDDSEMIAQKRYIELSMLCVAQGDIPFEQIEALKQSVVAVDEMGQPITELDLITEQIFYQSKIRFSQYENLEQQKAFFIEQLRGETGKTKPNYLLLEMLNVLLGMLDQAVMQIQAEAQQAAMMADPQVQLALAQEEQARADEQANAEREDANRKEERAASEKDSERQFEQNMASQEAGSQAELEKIALQGAIQAANQPEPAKKK